jgi:double-stranded uracil-DNA glycosylase
MELLRPGLKLVFCGYNPSLTSGRSGHHYAHPGNRFWRVLSASGITDRLYEPQEDETLLDLGIGFTNLCSRPTRRADELTQEEIRSGALALRQKLEQFRPQVVAYSGIGVYKWFRATSKVGWDVQEVSAVPGVTDVILPSPSGLNRMSFKELVHHYRALTPFLK